MRISVIVCTYRRSAELVRLLDCLAEQSQHDFETLVIDGSGQCDAVRAAVAEWQERNASRLKLRCLAAPTGLTRQRNVGLAAAQGDVICFLDDDVTLSRGFLADATELLDRPEHADVGGITGYDERNWPQQPTFRWRLRRRLGVAPSLRPGDADRLGRIVPLSFAPPANEPLEVHWLPGFCMIYRRQAVADAQFDEVLPTYGGEDRDFSLRIGQKWRLLLCGSLKLSHHQSPANRVRGLQQVYETAFGQGRGFRKLSRGWSDVPRLAAHLAAELFVDALAMMRSPSWWSLRQPFVRVRGLVHGFRSLTQNYTEVRRGLISSSENTVASSPAAAGASATRGGG